MNKITKLIKKTGNRLDKNAPTILAIAGAVGVIITVTEAIKATPKACDILDGKIAEVNKDLDEPIEHLEPIETIKETWKCYISTIVFGTLTIACIVGSNSLNKRRNAALLGAYAIMDKSYLDLKKKIPEIVGETKANEIQAAVAKQQIDEKPVSNSEVVVTGKGEMLCLDPFSMRYFKSTINDIEKAVNRINTGMLNNMNMYASLNELYYEIGLDPTVVGNDIGWRVDRGIIELKPYAQLTEGGEPCIVITYETPPEYGYNDMY